MSFSLRLAALAIVSAGAAPLLAQPQLPEWRLTKRSASIGEDIELHSVRAAAELPDGTIAIADGGNFRIVIATPAGELVRVIGREGSGPAEFRALLDLGAFGDTIVTFDAQLRRAAAFTTSGRLLRTMPLPNFDGRAVLALAFQSPSTFLVRSPGLPTPTAAGLLVDSSSIIRVRAAGGIDVIMKTAWDIGYRYVSDSSSTTYRTPFLGNAMLFASGEGLVLVPLAADHAVAIAPDGSRGEPMRLAVARAAFDRTLVDTYRDSLLAVARPRAASFPGAVQRIESVFGNSFPTPKERPVFESGRTVGSRIWLRAFPAGTEARSTWYVLDPRAGRFVARVVLPRSSRVIGGPGDRVLVLERDELNVEYVVAYAVATR